MSSSATALSCGGVRLLCASGWTWIWFSRSVRGGRASRCTRKWTSWRRTIRKSAACRVARVVRRLESAAQEVVVFGYSLSQRADAELPNNCCSRRARVNKIRWLRKLERSAGGRDRPSYLESHLPARQPNLPMHVIIDTTIISADQSCACRDQSCAWPSTYAAPSAGSIHGTPT